MWGPIRGFGRCTGPAHLAADFGSEYDPLDPFGSSDRPPSDQGRIDPGPTCSIDNPAQDVDVNQHDGPTAFDATSTCVLFKSKLETCSSASAHLMARLEFVSGLAHLICCT